MEPTYFAQKIVLMKKDKILILKRSHYKKDGDVWDLPGGSVDFGENCKEAIKRECLEEVGLKLKGFKPLDIGSGKGYTKGQYIFALLYSEDFKGEVKLSEEHFEFKWINPRDIGRYTLLKSVDLVKEVIAAL